MNIKMTKEEAQKIIDDISPDTIVDPNWLDYLISENREYTKLRALSIITGKTWNEIISCYEGEYITKFQTKKEIYVGRTVKIINDFYIILNQNKDFCYYVDSCLGINRIAIANINKHLV